MRSIKCSGVILSCLVTILVASFTLAAPATTQATKPAALGPGDHRRQIECGGRTRSFYLHVPPKYDAKKPAPVVLAYHGAMMNGKWMEQYSGLDAKADQANFIAVYPNGTGAGNGEALLTWNAWEMPAVAGRAKPDDVAFTAAMLDDLATVLNVDTKRVFATGLSNGGMMCYRLAGELSDRIAAIAPVSGTLAIEKCQPKRPVPVIHFHGTEDPLVPFNGPNAKSPRFLKFKSVDQCMTLFVKINGCPAEGKTTEIPNTNEDGLKLKKTVYGPGKDGAEVVLITIEGGGHTWPGTATPIPFLGATAKAISANEMMWEFFERHPMK